MKFFATARITDKAITGASEWRKLSSGPLENASGIFSQNIGFLNDPLRDAIEIRAGSARLIRIWPKRPVARNPDTNPDTEPHE